jgi:hypothetical protein
MAQVGIIDPWTPSLNNEHASSEFFATVQLELLPFG